MRKTVRLLCAIALCIGMLSAGHIHAFATESAQGTNYSALFTESQSVGPLSVGEYAERLSAGYVVNPQEFLNNLSSQPDDIILSVIGLWTTNLTTEELTSLHTQVSNYVPATYDKIIKILEEHISCREYGENLESYAEDIKTDDYSFDAATIKRLIDLNMEIEAEDEELNQILASAYASSPNLFATTISSYSDSEIATIAEKVAAGYVQQDMKAPKVASISAINAKNSDIINLIQLQIASALTLTIEPDDLISIPTDVEPMSLCVPTIGAMTYSSAPLVVGNAETLKITLTENTQISALRQWWVEVYQVVGSSFYLKSSQTVTMTPGSTSSTFSFSLSFSSTSNFYTRVKVYSAQ
jgi:hypothetical protein